MRKDFEIYVQRVYKKESGPPRTAAIRVRAARQAGKLAMVTEIEYNTGMYKVVGASFE